LKPSNSKSRSRSSERVVEGDRALLVRSKVAISSRLKSKCKALLPNHFALCADVLPEHPCKFVCCLGLDCLDAFHS
jgi:hypothetical protein